MDNEQDYVGVTVYPDGQKFIGAMRGAQKSGCGQQLSADGTLAAEGHWGKDNGKETFSPCDQPGCCASAVEAAIVVQKGAIDAARVSRLVHRVNAHRNADTAVAATELTTPTDSAPLTFKDSIAVMLIFYAVLLPLIQIVHLLIA